MLTFSGFGRPSVSSANAHIWRHLRSLNHAFVRSMDDSVVLTALDKDRLQTLAEFFRNSSGAETMELDQSLRPEALGRISHELSLAPHISLKATLVRTPEFTEWKRGWKDTEEELIERLTRDLQALASRANEPGRSEWFPPKEARIVSSVLQELIARTEPTVTR
jgi:hypothetical protein